MVPIAGKSTHRGVGQGRDTQHACGQTEPVAAHPGHGEGHHHASIRAGERHKAPLLAAFVVLAVFMVVEVVAGLATNSLALLSDAGHMVTDVIGVGMALAAIQLASRGSDRRHRTFGLYRLEILAALANAVLLAVVAGYRHRRGDQALRRRPGVDDATMLVVAVDRSRRQPRGVRPAARRIEGVVERRGRLPRGALRHRRIRRRDRRRRRDPGDRLVVDRSADRHRHRRLDPAAGVPTGGAGAAHRDAGGASQVWTSTPSPASCRRSTAWSTSTISTCGR